MGRAKSWKEIKARKRLNAGKPVVAVNDPKADFTALPEEEQSRMLECEMFAGALCNLLSVDILGLEGMGELFVPLEEEEEEADDGEEGLVDSPKKRRREGGMVEAKVEAKAEPKAVRAVDVVGRSIMSVLNMRKFVCKKAAYQEIIQNDEKIRAAAMSTVATIPQTIRRFHRFLIPLLNYSSAAMLRRLLIAFMEAQSQYSSHALEEQAAARDIREQQARDKKNKQTSQAGAATPKKADQDGEGASGNDDSADDSGEASGDESGDDSGDDAQDDSGDDSAQDDSAQDDSAQDDISDAEEITSAETPEKKNVQKKGGAQKRPPQKGPQRPFGPKGAQNKPVRAANNKAVNTKGPAAGKPTGKLAGKPKDGSSKEGHNGGQRGGQRGGQSGGQSGGQRGGQSGGQRGGQSGGGKGKFGKGKGEGSGKSSSIEVNKTETTKKVAQKNKPVKSRS